MQHEGSAASRVIWDWRERRAEGLREERRRRTRRLGTIQSAVGAGISAVIYLLGHPVFAMVVLGIAGFTLAAALLSPLGLSLRIQRFLGHVGTAVGHLVTWLLLVPLFLLFFVPFRLLFRRGRRDPLDRRLEPERATYWRTRTEVREGTEAYQRQF